MKKQKKKKCKKAEMNGLGMILIAFVGIVVGIALYTTLFGYVGQMTGDQVDVVNQTLITPANGAIADLTGQELVGTPVVSNGTFIITTGNYSVTECVKASTGLKGVCYKTLTAYGAAQRYNITYSYYADGYVDSSGGRGMVLLIPIFAALAIAVVALTPTLREGFLDMIGK